MASNQKEVKVKVATKEELDGVEALELRINKLQKQKIQVGIDIASQKLEDTQERINKLKQAKIDIKADAKKLSEVNSKMDAIDAAIRSSHNYNVNVSQNQLNKLKQELSQLEQEKINLEIATDDSKIKKIDAEIAQLDQKSLDLQLAIDTGELQKAKAEVDDLDGTEIDVTVNNISAMEALDQIGQGFDRLKSGASEVGQVMGDVLESSGRMEQTETFLSMNLGADVAKKKLEEIRSVTDKLPGDDVTLQNLLSQAALKDANMTTEAFTQMGSAAADYMAAMQNFGKSSTETQQDLMNYILAGNTAEIERSPILQSHIDKLKEATTVQERSKALQEALAEEGWNGIASQDIYNNKLQQFNDMIERGKMNFGDLFLKGSEGAMDFLMELDEASGGLVGMGIAIGSFATPLFDTFTGLSQMATGMKAIKDLGFIKWLKDLEIANKLAKISQLELNLAFLTNPIFLIVAAIIALIAVLAYLYFNNEQVRQAVDSLGQSFILAGQIIYTSFMNAINWIIGALQNFYNYVMTLGGLLPQNVNITGNQIIDSILAFLAFFATLPIQIGIVFMNILAKALGFGDNFVQRMIRAGSQSVSNFIGYISSLPGKLQSELSRMLSAVNEWAATLPQKFWEAGVNAVKNFLNALGIHSPGTMQRMLIWEISEMGKRVPEESKQLLSNVSNLGGNIVDSFGEPELGLKYEDTMNARLASRDDNNYSGDVIYNFNLYGDMDTEDRMKKFLDYVVKETHWNNQTAGRTI